MHAHERASTAHCYVRVTATRSDTARLQVPSTVHVTAPPMLEAASIQAVLPALMQLSPVTATVVRAVILAQTPSVSDLVGIALVMVGVAIHRSMRAVKRSVPAQMQHKGSALYALVKRINTSSGKDYLCRRKCDYGDIKAPTFSRYVKVGSYHRRR